MGGYNGFGLQKWIYKQRPRRPFSNDRKPTGDTISKNNAEFKLRKHKSLNGDNLKIAFASTLILLFVGFLVSQLNSATGYVAENNQKIEETERKKNEDAFKYLVGLGKQYSLNGYWEKAKTEFEFALKIKPNDFEAIEYYIQALITLCENENSYCNLCNDRIDLMISQNSNNAKLYKLKSRFLLINGDTLNASKALEKAQEISFSNNNHSK